jgi:LEA14-like dessication related protein
MRATLLQKMVAAALAMLLGFALGGCAGLGQEPLNVNVVGLEPLESQGMEARFAVKIRVQNPNDTPIEFDGMSLNLDLRGSSFASGVSDAKGTVPRFGETVLTVPVSVPLSSIVRQVVGFASGDRSKIDYRVRGRLSGPGLGGARFDSTGEVPLPKELGGVAK